MKKIELSLLIGFMVTVIISSILPFSNQYDKIKNNTIRLRVFSHSDYYNKNLSNIKSELKNQILSNFLILKNFNNKEKIIYLNNNKLNIKFSRSYFAAKKYQKLTIPAGMYDSIDVCLEVAENKNWCCTAFPSVGGMMYKNDDDILNTDTLDLDYKIDYRFAIIDAILKLKNLFSK